MKAPDVLEAGGPQAGQVVPISGANRFSHDPWPDPPDPEAFAGLAGDWVRLLDPHTESDPVAILVQFLVAFGNAVNRGPQFMVESDLHTGNLYTVLVGESAKARKGTSWGHEKRLFRLVDEHWVLKRIKGGLSSGEGVIWNVRDPIEEQKPIKEKGRVTGYQIAVTDPGETDKRLMLYEPEFASTLRVMTRDGSTLSAVLRMAWDADLLSSLTKNSQAVSTGAHVSLIGNITRDELRRDLTQTDMANGFGNRILWICIRRSKVLPEGGHVDPRDLDAFAERLGRTLDIARQIRIVERDDGARALWHEVYPKLSEGGPGLLGAITSRAEAQVTRLSLIYALLDGRSFVSVEDLRAALALWDFCARSARYIFGEAVGVPVQDAVLGALRQNPAGLSMTELHGVFGRNKSADEIRRALRGLQDWGLASVRKPETNGPGRPAERWFLAEGGSP